MNSCRRARRRDAAAFHERDRDVAIRASLESAARRAGALPITGLWLWGGGPTVSRLPTLRGAIAGADPLFAAWPALSVRPSSDSKPGRAAPRSSSSRSLPGTEVWQDAQAAWIAAGACTAAWGSIERLDLSAGERRYRRERGLAMALWRRTGPGGSISSDDRADPAPHAAAYTGFRRRAASGTAPRLRVARHSSSDGELDLSLPRLLPVGSLGGVGAAAELLAAHRAAGRVLVIGDFDADGATSSALVVRALARARLCARRFPRAQSLPLWLWLDARDRRARRVAQAPSLIVTVDNGVSSVEGVAAANALGIPVLVTDHHLSGCNAAARRGRSSIRISQGSTFASPGLGRRRRGVLPDRRAGSPAERCRLQTGRSAGFGRARHRRRRRSARSQ
jgi:hypothetical protein